MKTAARTAPSRERVLDPVCGMSVDADSPLRATHNGRRYHFCSAGCREEFLRNPERYERASPGPPKSTHRQEQAEVESDRASEPRPHQTPAIVHQRVEGRGKHWADYVPLLVIIVLNLLAASAKQIAYAE